MAKNNLQKVANEIVKWTKEAGGEEQTEGL
jgi:hypothetical protein